MASRIVRIDGSHGEGGGAMLRQALGFSMLLHQPFVMDGIRVGRERPGLSPQHLAAVNAAHRCCNAQVKGNWAGSTSLSFAPGPLSTTRLDVDIGTAGSVTLFLQSFLLPSLFSGKEFRIRVRGGTDVRWSVPVDYFIRVLLPQLRKYADVDLRLIRRGFYPKGGGEVLFTCKGKRSLGEDHPRVSLLERGEVFKVGGASYASAFLQPSMVAERQAEAARLSLSRLGVAVDLQQSYAASASPGSGVSLWAVCGGEEGLDPLNPVVLGASSLGERQLRAEAVGEEAAAALMAVVASGAACDEHLADQLVPVMALAGGALRTCRVTPHLRSNVYVAERFLDERFVIDEDEGVVRRGV
ncbi:RNA 3'-terminal phosphate cyclase [Candidatus Woesearchaeota archaeon]|nr:RNA 3'-terminal phosphate cyclase [Candidatus Woesearchaeota archaeon]